MKALILSLAIVLGTASLATAWDGYDWNKGSYVEIEQGNLVRTGETIEIYDYSDGRYKDVEVTDINRYGSSSVEVEVYDHETGEHRILDMDGR